MAERLSDLLKLLALGADDPDVMAAFVTFERPSGEVSALIACTSGLRRLCDETILLATEAAHKPADGLH